MRKLSNIKARVERLARQIGTDAGCAVCQADERRFRPLAAGDPLPSPSICRECGRRYTPWVVVLAPALAEALGFTVTGG